MTALWAIFRLTLRDQRRAVLRGSALGVLVLVMGAALLGLSGWFITASAAAGLAGVGATFDVFRPSAMVRFLALGRAAARYGERLLTHDATLRTLESLRLRLLSAQMAAPYPRLIRLRGAQVLNRITGDIDLLDGVPLRLILPLVAGVLTHLMAGAALWVLVAPVVALWICLGYLTGAALIFVTMAKASQPVSRRLLLAAQAFRSRFIDLIRGRRDLAVYGRLVAQGEAVVQAEARRLALRRDLDRTERRAGAALGLLASGVAAVALGLGMTLAQTGQIGAGFAALGFFAALALAETLTPLRRAVADLGAMADAARRVVQDLAQPVLAQRTGASEAGDLVLTGVALCRPGSSHVIVQGISLHLKPGETLAITGASGQGKSTLLLAIAGLQPLAAGQISLGGLALNHWSEADLRRVLTLLPQRSALMAGTVAEALLAAGPASEAQMWAALAAVQLDEVIAARGGLSLRIGPRGDGLSGGEARRLALARALLRNPRFLLLDEPTEGLDDTTATAVLRGVRQMLPGAALLIAAHRPLETDFADRVLALQ